MLEDLMTGRAVTKIPYEADYRRWIARLDPGELASVKAALNAMIDGDEIHTSGWMPGSNWSGTPFEPIYEKAANCDFTLAAKCFGLIVYEVFMERPERWTFGKFEKDGEPIGCTTYFRPKR